MIELKGPGWYQDAAPKSVRDSQDRLALDYSGPATNAVTPESLSQNVGTNQTLRSGNAPSNRVLALAAPEPESMAQTSFKGTTSTIKVENVIMLDANGLPAGSAMPLGAVSNPVMNPLYATMYTPYITSYNNMILNPNAYYNAVPYGMPYSQITFVANQNSSLAGFPQMPRPQTDELPPP